MTPERLQRLQSAIEPSYKKLEPARENMKRFQSAIAGPYYMKNDESGDRPLNMLEMWHSGMLQNLSSANPQVLCLTHKPQLKAAAREKELALNQTLKRMRFADEHRKFVSSMLLGVGIMQVGLETVDRRMVDEEMLAITNVFVEAIMLEDFVFDVTANKWNTQQVTFAGHKYRMPLEWIRNNPDFDKEERERVTEREFQSKSMDTMSKGSEVDSKFTDMGELWSLFVPEEGEIVTFMVSNQGQGASSGNGKALRTQKWTGPRHGPYHFKGFLDVLNNVMPLPPIANLIDIDDLVNKTYAENGKAASRQKDLILASLESAKDGQKYIDAPAGTVVICDRPGEAKQISLGGVNQMSLAASQQFKADASYAMGNLDSMFGLGQEAGTLGQEKLIKSSVNDRIRGMQVAVSDVTEDIIRDIAFYLHKHPVEQMNLTMDIPGSDMKLPITWPMQEDEWGNEFDSREGEHEDYDIQIVPFSMQSMTPGERSQLLRDIWQRDILPIIGTGAPPPSGFDVYLKYLAKYYSMPEIAEIYPASQEQVESRSDGMRKPPVTNREYTRTSISGGASPRAQQQQMQMMLMSGGGVANSPKMGS